MPLSSNTIIHFTRTKQSLMGILENNFQIHYCKETTKFDGDDFGGYLVPMVSFCDIPLSEIKEHISKYGTYGIGLTKEWAERQGLNPVLYINEKSSLAACLRDTIDEYVIDKDGDLEDLSESEKKILDIIRYTKNYESDLNRGGNSIPNYRYSDEREWRYVPPITDDCSMVFGLDYASHEANTHDLERSKRLLKKQALAFEPDDIKYIIIESDDEISDFLDFLRKVKGKTYSYHNIERLMTRILTAEQIFTDI